MVIPISVLPWHSSLMVIIGGLVLGVKLVGIGNMPIGIESLWRLLVEHVVICDVPLGVHPLMWCLLVLGSLLGVRVLVLSLRGWFLTVAFYYESVLPLIVWNQRCPGV